MKMEVNPRQFYKMGMVCFGVIFLANFYNLIAKWSLLNIAGQISTTFSVIFNLGLFLFFNYLRKQLPPIETEKEMPNQEELNDLLESLK